MYFSDLGTISLWAALLSALVSIVLSLVSGAKKSPRLLAYARAGLIIVASCLLFAALILFTSFLRHDFGVAYVASHSSLSMPWYYVTAAFYGGQEGSLLYWACTLGIFSLIFLFTVKRAPREFVPYVIATLLFILLFLTIVLVFASNPFIRLVKAPADGKGLNPLLMDPGMLIHPPMLLLGFMSFSLPFAFAIAAMITGKLTSDWLRSIRRWMLAAWSIQTAGLVLGAWWAYHVLGWGGYWGWDPVENAALLPWLTSTAFLHSTMVQERRGMLKVWNLWLVIGSFALAIFGTFEVRSGVISSVHSFAYSDIGSYYFAFLMLVLVTSIGLFVWRWRHFQAEQEFDSLFSREGVFLLNNFLLVGVTFATLWGTIFPLLSAFFRQQTMTVGPIFYQQVVSPLIGVLLFAMGIGPLLAWRRSTLGAFWRNVTVPAIFAALCAIILPVFGVLDVMANIGFSLCAFTLGAILYELWRGVRVRHGHGENYLLAFLMLFQRYRQRYGGYLVHLGFVLLIAGVIGSHFFQQTRDATLQVGQELEIAGYQLRYQGNVQSTLADKDSVRAQIEVWHDGQLVSYIHPGRDIYRNFDDQPASIIEISTFGANDLYVFMAAWQDSRQVTLRAFWNPLVIFVWLGGLLMLFGGVICWWPAALTRRHETHSNQEEEVEKELEPSQAGSVV